MIKLFIWPIVASLLLFFAPLHLEAQDTFNQVHESLEVVVNTVNVQEIINYQTLQSFLENSSQWLHWLFPIVTGLLFYSLVNLLLKKIFRQRLKIYESKNSLVTLLRTGLVLILVYYVLNTFAPYLPLQNKNEILLVLGNFFKIIFMVVLLTQLNPLFSVIETFLENFLKKLKWFKADQLSKLARAFIFLIQTGLALVGLSVIIRLFFKSINPGAIQTVMPLINKLMITLYLTFIIFYLLKSFSFIRAQWIQGVARLNQNQLQAVQWRSVKLISVEQVKKVIGAGIWLFYGFISFIFLYFYLAIIFSFYHLTASWASFLINRLLQDTASIILAVIRYLPNLLLIAVIIALTWFVSKIISIIFNEIGNQRIRIPGFYADWADPTYKIVRFLIIVFSVILIFPYLPGSNSIAFKGISVFLGVLISFGSSTAISNIVAGVVITYMRPFKVGDRVKIADTVGDIAEKTLLVTRIRTIKNSDITIPNALVLGSHIINYSTSAQQVGLILNTTVTIGYDVPWRKVHELLIAAANKTGRIMETPQPFILQKSLNDYHVSYELNVYTDQPNQMANIYSELHQNIQDHFNQAGIEILSPMHNTVHGQSKNRI